MRARWHLQFAWILAGLLFALGTVGTITTMVHAAH
jgi:hypothetical protein